MRTHKNKGFRPHLESIENRCLLSVAVLEILNQSTYTVSFDFRWTPSSSWNAYSEQPGHYSIFWTGYSTSLAPQALYNTTTSAGSQTTVNLVQGYNQWSGTGTPPASAAKLYEFQNSTTGVGRFYVPPTPPPPPTSTDAVVEIQNQSTYTITFDFRWSPASSWTAYTESPGQYEILWTSYSSFLTPQALYNTTTSAGSQTTVNLVQGYNQWTGTGTPPASAAKDYEFLNTSTGVQLYYSGSTPNPPPTPAPNPNAFNSTNWSGYVAETNFSQPQANSVSAVYGSWIVPTVTGPSSGATYGSVWVGIDGYGNKTVEQVGTEEDWVNGRPVYDAWWEMYSTGKGQPEQVITGMTVSPGDSITASVQYITSGAHAGQFYLSIVDNSRTNDAFSTYQSSSQLQSPLAQRSSAEWIVEATTVGGSIATVPNFGSVTFANATVVINGISGAINAPSWQSRALNLASNGVTYDTTSVLTSLGTSFVVTYNSSAGAAVLAGSNVEAKTQSGAAVGATLPSGKKIGSPVLGGPAWTGATGLSGFRTPIRQLKRSAQGFLIDHRWN